MPFNFSVLVDLSFNLCVVACWWNSIAYITDLELSLSTSDFAAA